jgi:serine protease Do
MSANTGKHDRFTWSFLRFAVAALVLSAAVALWASISPQLLAAERGPLLPAEDAVAPASFAGIIEAVEPGVVNVSVRGQRMSNVRAMQPELPFEALPPGSPFEDFLRRFFGDRAVRSDPEADPEGVPFRGMGTGFIIDPEGLVVTNYHVIDSADEIIVRLHDGSEHKATLRGHDPKTDLALLDIEGDDFPYLLFGDSDAARVGDWVIAVGNPFGLGGSATAGIISARGRDIQSGPYDDFLQIDAPINQGNSGGPLFDLSGKVVGVNTAIFSPNGGNVGIGFAIPASLAEKIIDELRENGRIERGWLGVSVQSLDADIAAGLGLAGPEGALVASVVPGGPAERAGLQAGDVIVAIDGEPVADVRDLVARIGDADPASSIELDVWRRGERQTLDATLGAGPDAEIPVTAPQR